jgi:hypothetical protein
VRRLLVKKDANNAMVTSPVVQDMGKVDMGDWRNLADFVRWGVKNYPAKKYLLVVWNHGGGWKSLSGSEGPITRDISWDDTTGNRITTAELGQAMREIQGVLGRKLDVYASDACLMSMVEVASEMAGAVKFFGGSQANEPGTGWAYDAFLGRLTARPTVEGDELVGMLTESYYQSYRGGTQGTSEVTFSGLDLSAQAEMERAVRDLAREIRRVSPSQKLWLRNSLALVQGFDVWDYADLGHLARTLEKNPSFGVDPSVTAAVRSALSRYVLVNAASPSRFPNASGVSIWLPRSPGALGQAESRYRELQFPRATDWLDALGSVYR